MIPTLLLSGLAIWDTRAARVSFNDQLSTDDLSTDLGDHGGVIRVGDGSTCLDVYGDNIHASKVTIYAAVCNGDQGQVWKHEGGALKNVASGRCLGINEASTKNGANLILHKCNGQKNQQFQFNKGSGSISQPKSSKCLDVDMASNIKNVLLWTCKNSPNQKMGWAAEWSLSQASETVSTDAAIRRNQVRFNNHRRRYVALPEAWDASPEDHGGVIRVGDGSRCLDVLGDTNNRIYPTIYAAVCNGGPKQVWKHEGGRLRNVASGGCICRHRALKGGATLALSHQCNGHPQQQFQFNKASRTISQPLVLIASKSGWGKKKERGRKCLEAILAHPRKQVVLWTCRGSLGGACRGPLGGACEQQMGWAAEWSLSQASETLAVDNAVSTDAQAVEADLGDHGGVIRVGDGLAGIDCTKSACQKECKCTEDKCASQVKTCLADATCAKAHACALRCPCRNTPRRSCALKCAQVHSPKAFPLANCIIDNCNPDK